MAKRFKLKFSSVIPYSLRFCRPKHSSSTFPVSPVPAKSSYRLSLVNPKVIDIAFPNLPPPPSTPRSPPCHVSSSSSVDCGCRSGSCAQFLFSSGSRPRRKVHCDTVSVPSGDFGADRSIKKYEKYGAKKKKKKTSDWFSEEEAALLSSSVDSVAGNKVRESYAVVKRSKDPQEDFKRSMMEMIVEKKMVEAEELEELLQCFLSINSRTYHRVIVLAFSEIWVLLFSDPPTQLP